MPTATKKPAARAPKARRYVAIQSFECTIGDTVYRVTKDQTRVAEGHALLNGGRDRFFRAEDIPSDVEDATNTPGEKRA